MTTPEAGHTAERIASSRSPPDVNDQPCTDKLCTDKLPTGGIDSRTTSTEKDAVILNWEGDHDPGNPYHWSLRRKWLVTCTALFATLIVPLNGSAITVASGEINTEFNVSDASFPNSYWIIASWNLGGALFILLLLSIMEDTGVRIGYMVTYAFFLLMIVGQAVAQNYATLIVTRFFSGGCVALLANTICSVIPDIWEDDVARSVPVGLYIVLYLMGNTVGPPMFAGVMQYIGNWRWIFYIQLIIYGTCFPLFVIMLKETRGSVILRWRAKRLRKETGQPIYTQSEANAAPLRHRIYKSMTRPGYLLFTEPVLFATTLWSAFCFGTVFLFTQSVEQVFASLYGWKSYSTGYVQGAVVIGELLGWVATLYSTRLYLASASRNTEAPGRPIPEARLYVSAVGSFVGIAGGMFVYAWTSYAFLPWIAPAIGLAMVGFGIMVVVTSAADYITDAYAASDFAGSAISAVATGEYVVAAFLPLAAQSMYTNLGFHWASSLLGFLALLLSCAPVMFIWKGRSFRARSPFMQAGGQVHEKTGERG